MATASSALPESLQKTLDNLGSTIRILRLVRGIGLLLAVLCGGLMLCILTDWVWAINGGWRLTAVIGLAISSILLFEWMVRRPFNAPLTNAELAAVIETSHPELQERLLSTVELGRSDTAIRSGTALEQFYRSQLIDETTTAVSSFKTGDSISKHRSKWSITAGLSLATMFTIPFFLAPEAYPALLSRLLVPLGNHASVGSFFFEVDRLPELIARGTDLEVSAKVLYRSSETDLPEVVELEILSASDATPRRQTLVWENPDRRLQATVSDIQEPLRLRLVADGVHSEWFIIDVDDAPVPRSLQVRIDPPAYTNRPARDWNPVEGTQKVWESSRLTWTAELSKPVQTAELIWIDGALSRDDETKRRSWQLAADGLSASFQMNATDSGQLIMRFTDTRGLSNPDGQPRQLTVIRDTAPGLNIVSGPHQKSVQPDDLISIMVLATDDVGLGELELHLEVNGAVQQVVPSDGPIRGQRMIEATFEQDLAGLELKPGDAVSYRFRATDERPIPQPNESWSDYRFVQIVAKAAPPESDRLQAEHEQLKAEISRLKTELRNSQEQVEKQRKEPIGSNSEKQQADALERLSDDQIPITQQLALLADQLQTHPLFNSFAEQTRNIADEQLPDAQKALNKAAEEPENRSRMLGEASDLLDDAANSLERIEEKFERVAELERDLQELQRISRASQRLMNSLAAADSGEDESLELTAEQLLQLESMRANLEERLAKLVEEHSELRDSGRTEARKNLDRAQDQLQELRSDQRNNQQQEAFERQQTDEGSKRILNRLDAIERQLAEIEDQWKGVADPGLVEKDTERIQQKLREAREHLEQSDLGHAAKELGETARSVDDSAIRFDQQARQRSEKPFGFEEIADRQKQLNEALDSQSESEDTNPATEKLGKLALEQAEILEKANRLATSGGDERTADPERELLREQAFNSGRKTLDALLENDTATARKSGQSAERDFRALAEKQSGAEPDNAVQTAPPESSNHTLLPRLAQQRQELREIESRLQTESTPENKEELQKQRDSLRREIAEDLAELSNEGLELPKSRVRKALGKSESSSDDETAPPTVSESNALPDALENLLETASAQERGKQPQPGLDPLADPSASDLANMGQQLRRIREELTEQIEEMPPQNQNVKSALDGDPEADSPDEPKKSDGPPATDPGEPELDQQKLSEFVKDLEQRLESLEQQTLNERFDLEASQTSIREARKQLDKAISRMEESEQEQIQGNSGSAESASREASDQLQQAGESLQEAERTFPPPSSDNPVPEQVGRELGRAFEQLNQAQRLLQDVETVLPQEQSSGTAQQPEANAESEPGESRSEPRDQEGPGQPGDGSSQDMDQSGDNADDAAGSEGAPGAGEQGTDGQSGESDQLEQTLEQLADALSQAAENVEPGQSNGQWQPGNSGSSNGTGTNESLIEGQLLELLLNRKPGRDWGRLPGHLKTEILQGAETRSNRDYQKLIKIYFNEISRLRGEGSATDSAETGADGEE